MLKKVNELNLKTIKRIMASALHSTQPTTVKLPIMHYTILLFIFSWADIADIEYFSGDAQKNLSSFK